MFDTDGPVAEDIAWLWWFMVVLGTIAFAFFVIALVVGLRRGAARHDDAADPSPRALRRWVIVGGVIVPTIILIPTLVATIVVMGGSSAGAPSDVLRVEVIGHRWWYEIRYPDHGVETANELHLPVSRPVELSLSSSDVIHSFWLPALAGKLDMLPDTTNTLVLEATEVGEHQSQCAEFCGLQHAKMRLLATVETQADFATWLEDHAADAVLPADPIAVRGQELFADTGCASCHTVRGTDAVGTAGPDLTHMSRRSTIASASAPLTPDSLRNWIVDPDDLKDGVLMPPTSLDGAELDALLAYLDTLR